MHRGKAPFFYHEIFHHCPTYAHTYANVYITEILTSTYIHTFIHALKQSCLHEYMLSYYVYDYMHIIHECKHYLTTIIFVLLLFCDCGIVCLPITMLVTVEYLF